MNRRSPSIFGNVMMRIALTMFVMTVITIYLLGGVLARYMTSSSGSDSARVAKFGNLTLTETGDFDGTAANKAILIPGVDLQKKAVVHFDGSETASIVFVEVILSSHWQRNDDHSFAIGQQVTWSVDTSQWTYLKPEENNRYIYYKILAPNESLTADIIADDGKIAVSPSIQKNQIQSLNGSFINLRAGVIQSGGFASVEAAWAALDAK